MKISALIYEGFGIKLIFCCAACYMLGYPYITCTFGIISPTWSWRLLMFFCLRTVFRRCAIIYRQLSYLLFQYGCRRTTRQDARHRKQQGGDCVNEWRGAGLRLSDVTDDARAPGLLQLRRVILFDVSRKRAALRITSHTSSASLRDQRWRSSIATLIPALNVNSARQTALKACASLHQSFTQCALSCEFVPVDWAPVVTPNSTASRCISSPETKSHSYRYLVPTGC